MSEVHARLGEFVSVRAITLAAVGPLSQAQLDFSPRAGRWSVGEIADHLLRAEEMWRGNVEQLVALARAGQPAYRRQTFAEVNVAPLYLPDAVLAWMARPLAFANQFVPDRVIGLLTEVPLLPTRSPDVGIPRAGRPAAALKADLAESIGRTRALIESNVALDFDQLVSEHPVTGRTNVAQVLTILARHERRHQGQMERVREDARFPR